MCADGRVRFVLRVWSVLSVWCVLMGGWCVLMAVCVVC